MCMVLINVIKHYRLSCIPGVHDTWLPDDETVSDQFADCVSGVGRGDVVGLVGVQPHLILATLENRGCQPLLHLQRHHYESIATTPLKKHTPLNDEPTGLN